MPKKTSEYPVPLALREPAEGDEQEFSAIVRKSLFKRSSDAREYYTLYRERIFRYLAMKYIQEQTGVIPSYITLEASHTRVPFLKKESYLYRVFCYYARDQLPLQVKVTWYRGKFSVEMKLVEISQQVLAEPRKDVVR